MKYLLVLQIGNEGMIQSIFTNNSPSNPNSHPFPAWNAPVRILGDLQKFCNHIHLNYPSKSKILPTFPNIALADSKISVTSSHRFPITLQAPRLHSSEDWGIQMDSEIPGDFQHPAPHRAARHRAAPGGHIHLHLLRQQVQGRSQGTNDDLSMVGEMAKTRRWSKFGEICGKSMGNLWEIYGESWNLWEIHMGKSTWEIHMGNQWKIYRKSLGNDG